MTEQPDKRRQLDEAADRMVKSYRDQGVQIDYDRTRERLRRNLIREESKNKPRQ